MNMSCRQAHSGFTLLEMLVGLVLMGFILVLLFGALRLGTRSWDAGDKIIVSSSQQSVASGFIRNALERIFPMRWKVDGEEFIAFEGEVESISFVGPILRRQGKMANYMIRMAVVNEGKSTNLEMYWRVIGPQEQGFAYLEDGERTILLKGMGKVEFAYFGGETELSDPVWRNNWSRSGALPQLIRIRISSSDGIEWPELVVAPTLDSDSDPANVRGRVCILC